MGGGFVREVVVGGLVEEGVELVVFFLADGVIFVGVAFGAFEGESHPGVDGGGDAIFDGDGSEFFVAGAAFVVVEGVSVEGGGEDLVFGGIGEEITGEHFG